MLTRSGLPLPAEIYHLIYSHLGRSDLAQLLTVCHVLFEYTAPFVWQAVDLVSLLKLFPGCNLRGKDKKLDIFVPHTFSANHFDRFHLYAPHVERLEMMSRISITGGPVSQSAQDWILSYTSSHAMLPLVRAASLSFRTDLSACHQEIFWTKALIPDTLQELIFRACRQSDMQLVGVFLAKSLSLTRFEFHLLHEKRIIWDQWDPWSAVAEFRSSPELETLDFESLGLNAHALSWMSRMTNLHTLRLSYAAGLLAPQDEQNPIIAENFQNSFDTLRSLTVNLTNKGWAEILRVWRTPIVANLTHVAIEGHKLGQLSHEASHIGQAFTKLASLSPRTHHFEIIETGKPSERHMLRLPLALLSNLSTWPLHILKLQRVTITDGRQNILEKIGKLWPQLEGLCLDGEAVELRELLNLSSYLPKLRHLHICLPEMKDSREALSLTHGVHMMSLADPIPEDCSCRPTLTVKFHTVESATETFEYDLKDQDFLARKLVALSSSVNIVGISESMKRHDFCGRVSYYLEERSRSLGCVISTQ